MSLQHLSSGLKVLVGQYSSPGVKPVNEDAIGIRIPEGSALTSKGIVAVIADGVSAAEEGRAASNTAVTSFLADYYSTHDTWSVERSASKVITALNQWLYGLSSKFIRAEKGYVTTFSAAVFKSASAYLFHVGDSRVYRLRDGAIEQITRDHTANVGRKQSYLTRALGIDVNLDVDFHHLDIHPGDLFLFTTDGVHGWLKNGDFVAVLGPCARGEIEVGSLDPLCRKLVDMALERGSDDNLSVQLVRIERTDELAQQDLLAAVTNLPFPPPLQPGQKIDHWRVIREIHASTRSEVYLVEEEGTGRKAVLKAPSALLSDDPAYIERFILEEWVGSRIASSQVVKVIRPEQPKHFLYYLTEYVEGPTLGRLLKERTRLAVVDAQNILTQVISGLRAFHRRDVLHQDIKPDNIIYTDRGVKIIDFGSCRSAGVHQINSRINQEDKLGTRDYCAPEYLLNTPVSPLSDQFSLAVLGYELLTGKHPFGAHYQRCQTEQEFAKLRYIPAHTINPLVPLWLDAALQKALSIDPARRYPALSEFAQDIQKPNPELRLQRQSDNRLSDSLFFWKALVAGLVVTNLVTVLLLVGN